MRKTWRQKYKLRQAVKESFDYLPSGICFFDEKGLPILCNLKMQQLIFQITGQNLQSIYDIERLRQVSEKENILTQYSGDMLRPKLQKRDILSEYNTDLFLLKLQNKENFSEEIWQFQKKVITEEKKERYMYTQVVASEVTEFYKKREKLAQENEKLEEERERIKLLSQNIEEVSRQEEILNAKIDVHRQIGESLAKAQQILRGEGM